MARTRSENRPTTYGQTSEVTEVEVSSPRAATPLPAVPGCSIMIKSRMIKRLHFSDLERASENNTQVDYPSAEDCTVFVMPIQLPNEGGAMHELRQLLHDEAVCLDRRSEQQRLWSLRVDAATILTKLVQLRFAVVSCCVSSADDVYTWTLTAVDSETNADRQQSAADAEDEPESFRVAKSSTQIDRKPQISNGTHKVHATQVSKPVSRTSAQPPLLNKMNTRRRNVKMPEIDDFFGVREEEEEDAENVVDADDDDDDYADKMFQTAATKVPKSVNSRASEPPKGPPIRGFMNRNINEILPNADELAENSHGSTFTAPEDDGVDDKSKVDENLDDEERFRMQDEAECNYVKREGNNIYLGAPPCERRITAYKLQLLERTFILSAKVRVPRYKAFIRHVLQDTIPNDEAITFTTTTAPANLKALPQPYATAIVELVRLGWKRRHRLSITSLQRQRLVEQNKWRVSREPPPVDEIYEYINSYFHELRTVASKQVKPIVPRNNDAVLVNKQKKLDAEARKAGDCLGQDRIVNAEFVFGRSQNPNDSIFAAQQPTKEELVDKCQELYTSLYKLADYNGENAGGYDNVATALRHVRLSDGYLYLGEPPFQFRISVVKFHKLKQHTLLDSRKPIFSLFTTRLLRGTIPMKIAVQYTTVKSQSMPDLKVLPEPYIDAVEDIVGAVWYEMSQIVRPTREDNTLLDPTNIWCASLDEEQPLPPTREKLRTWIYTSLGNVRIKRKQLDEEARAGKNGPKKNRWRRTLVEILPSDEEAEELTRAAEQSPDDGTTDEEKGRGRRKQKQRGYQQEGESESESESKSESDSDYSASGKKRRRRKNESESEDFGGDDDDNEVDDGDDVSFEGEKKAGKKRSRRLAQARPNSSKKRRFEDVDETSAVSTTGGGGIVRRRAGAQAVEDDADYTSTDLRVVLAGPHATEPFDAGKNKQKIPALPYPQHIELKDGYLYLGEAPERRRLSLKKYQLIKLTVLLNAAKTPKFSIFVRRLAFATIPQSEAVFYTANQNNKTQRSIPLTPLPPAYLQALEELIYSAWHSTRRLYIQRVRRMKAATTTTPGGGGGGGGKSNKLNEKWKVPDRAMTTKEIHNALSTYLKDVRDDVQAMQQKNWKRKRRPLALLNIMPSDDEDKMLSKGGGDDKQQSEEGGAAHDAPAKSKSSNSAVQVVENDDEKTSQVLFDADEEQQDDDDDDDLLLTEQRTTRGGDEEGNDEPNDGGLKVYVRGEVNKKAREKPLNVLLK